jgi:hypothetical protein
VFDDLISLFDCRSQDALQNNVRVNCRDVFPFWIAIDVFCCIQTFHANDAVKCVDVDEGEAVFHLKFHEVIDPFAKLGDLGSLLKQVVMISDVVSDRSMLVVE